MKKVIWFQLLLFFFAWSLEGFGFSAHASDLLVSSFETQEILRYDQQTGNFITVFAESTSEGDELENPGGMVFGPDGHLYVASQGENSVVRFDGQTGAVIDEFVLPGDGGLVGPSFLIFGPDGNLYVSSFSEQVLRYDGTTGAFLDVFAEGQGMDDPFGMAFGPDGNFYVASFRSDEVLRFDGITGAFIDVFASGDSPSFPQDSMFAFPSALTFGPDNHLYVMTASASVVRFDGQTGAFIDEFIAEGSGGSVSITNMLFGPDGHLYVSDFFGPGGNGAVFRYDGTTGAFMDLLIPAGSGSGGGLNGATGLAFFPVVTPTEIWSKQDGTTGKDSATTVAVGDGVFVAGVTTGTLAGQQSAGGQDAFLQKYDLGGNLECTDQFGTSGDETVTGMRVSGRTVYVSGDTTGVFAGEKASGGDDLFVRQYVNDCQAGWTTQFGTAGDDLAALGLGLTPDGTSLFMGNTTDSGLGGDTQAILQKLDITGNLGCQAQLGILGIRPVDRGLSLNSPAVMYAGTTDGGPFGGRDGFVSQIDLNCQHNWTSFFGTTGDDILSGLGVGPDDDAPEAVFVGSTTTGAYPGTVNAGDSDFVLQRYNFTSGALDWTLQWGTAFKETGGVVANSPFVWMSGTTTGAFPGFDNAGGSDIVIRKYGLDGNELYTTQFGTTEDDQILALAHTADATSIFVVGDTLGAFTGQTNQGGQDFFVKRLEVTSDPAVLLEALEDLVSHSNLQQGILNSLNAKLHAALVALHNNDVVTASNALGDFINAVEAQRGKKILDADADRFITDAQTILTLLNGL